jgi:hypothetical protein
MFEMPLAMHMANELLSVPVAVAAILRRSRRLPTQP